MNGIQKAGLWLLMIVLLGLSPGLFRNAEWDAYTDKVAVIAYHHIDDDIVGDVTISSRLFRDQLTDLLERGYHFITLSQFKAFLAGGPVPPNAVLVTFDDGYQSFYTRAYPILQELNIPAVNFVITKDLEQPLMSHIPSLSKDQIKQMTRENQGIDVQCHTDSLHDRAPNGGALFTTRLTDSAGVEETQAQFEQRIIDDTELCRSKLESIYSRPVDSFAFPFGIYDAKSAQLLNKAGIRYAYTTVSGLTERGTDPMQIPRINAGSPFVRANSLNNLILKRLHGL
ncbi:polysaccharide deacetylase family protein [Paenibacillus doosanensis]|uniref:polysaccharide deacetylase family protein n=1 Tax=Paenibacillus doosanensis TaxID=1229154 RepID=UPI00217F285E|nr:polysaccharide deacetylase family protein [Paenibacillus doosanensis]MCS7463123.1 polysaccharide deacetylase family protein [Paenibacillus doosanensis]